MSQALFARVLPGQGGEWCKSFPGNGLDEAGGSSRGGAWKMPDEPAPGGSVPRYGPHRTPRSQMGNFRIMLVLGLGLVAWVWDWMDGPPPSFPTSGYEVTDGYRELRGGVFEVDPEQPADPAAEPRAVLIEIGMPEAVATVVARPDGGVSAYASDGRTRFFSRTREIAAHTEPFRREMASAASGMDRTMEYPLPASGRVRFYVVGADGVRTTEVDGEVLANGGHRLSPLFRLATSLVDALHEAD